MTIGHEIVVYSTTREWAATYTDEIGIRVQIHIIVHGCIVKMGESQS